MIVALDDGSWIVPTPESFFDHSTDGPGQFHLVRALEALPIEQVHGALYRPDLVRDALAADSHGKLAPAAAELDLQ